MQMQDNKSIQWKQMNIERLKQQKQAVVRQFGPWTASNIHLLDHFYTIGEAIQGDEIKLRRVLQVASDATRRPLKTLRVLDLACHEGIYAIEFARQGANVVGIEGREAHIAKANFVKEALSLSNLDLCKDDVRNLSREKYGSFDVVLCLGILYHLDAPDVFSFIERIAEVCEDIAIVDTRIAFGPTQPYVYKNTRYWGHHVNEGHYANDTVEQKMKRYWASLDNLTSFNLSRTSLYSMLGRAGFTSVYECYIPPEPTKPIDRITLLAIKGSSQTVISCPMMATYPRNNAPEDFAVHKLEKIYGKLFRIARLIPEKVIIFMASHGFLGYLFRPFKPRK